MISKLEYRAREGMSRGKGASKVGPYFIKVHFSTQYSVIGNISIIE